MIPKVDPLLRSTNKKPLFKEVGMTPGTIPKVAGYRLVFADELQMGSPMFKEMQKQVNKWAILWLINGWTEGPGYKHRFGSTITDNGERLANIGCCLFVNKEYPVIFQGCTIVQNGQKT